MSPAGIPVDDPEILRRILANAEALLLDFDGPVCSVFAGIPAHLVAHQLRGVLADGGHDELPADVDKAEDPFDVLRYAATLGRDEVRYVEASMRAHEVEAVVSAHPTPGAHDLIRRWHARGRKLAIVSNNSSSAVETYLRIHGLAVAVDFVSSRAQPDPALLKPSPFLLHQATEAFGIAPAAGVLVGDSVTDIQAGRAGGTAVIGYANKPGKIEVLSQRVPDAIITGLELLVRQQPFGV